MLYQCSLVELNCHGVRVGTVGSTVQRDEIEKVKTQRVSAELPIRLHRSIPQLTHSVARFRCTQCPYSVVPEFTQRTINRDIQFANWVMCGTMW